MPKNKKLEKNLNKDDLVCEEHKFSQPRNKSQYKYVKELKNMNNKIIVATGPAGTGKTLFATEYAIKQYLLKNCEKIIFTRPYVSAGENIGFLPGSIEDKMAPWTRPIFDILHNFINPHTVKKMIDSKIIEICPLGFMRGRTFKNSWIIADEMQNSTPSQMKMILTRIGENTRIVITGDLEQNDLSFKNNGLDDFLNKFKGKRSDSITSIEFNNTDIERDEIVKEVLEIYSGVSVPNNYTCEYINDKNYLESCSEEEENE